MLCYACKCVYGTLLSLTSLLQAVTYFFTLSCCFVQPIAKPTIARQAAAHINSPSVSVSPTLTCTAPVWCTKQAAQHIVRRAFSTPLHSYPLLLHHHHSQCTSNRSHTMLSSSSRCVSAPL